MPIHNSLITNSPNVTLFTTHSLEQIIIPHSDSQTRDETIPNHTLKRNPYLRHTPFKGLIIQYTKTTRFQTQTHRARKFRHTSNISHMMVLFLPQNWLLLVPSNSNPLGSFISKNKESYFVMNGIWTHTLEFPKLGHNQFNQGMFMLNPLIM